MEGFEDTTIGKEKKYISLKKPKQKKIFSNMNQFSIRMIFAISNRSCMLKW